MKYILLLFLFACSNLSLKQKDKGWKDSVVKALEGIEKWDRNRQLILTKNKVMKELGIPKNRYKHVGKFTIFIANNCLRTIVNTRTSEKKEIYKDLLYPNHDWRIWNDRENNAFDMPYEIDKKVIMNLHYPEWKLYICEWSSNGGILNPQVKKIEQLTNPAKEIADTSREPIITKNNIIVFNKHITSLPIFPSMLKEIFQYNFLESINLVENRVVEKEDDISIKTKEDKKIITLSKIDSVNTINEEYLEKVLLSIFKNNIHNIEIVKKEDKDIIEIKAEIEGINEDIKKLLSPLYKDNVAVAVEGRKKVILLSNIYNEEINIKNIEKLIKFLFNTTYVKSEKGEGVNENKIKIEAEIDDECEKIKNTLMNFLCKRWEDIEEQTNLNIIDIDHKVQIENSSTKIKIIFNKKDGIVLDKEQIKKTIKRVYRSYTEEEYIEVEEQGNKVIISLIKKHNIEKVEDRDVIARSIARLKERVKKSTNIFIKDGMFYKGDDKATLDDMVLESGNFYKVGYYSLPKAMFYFHNEIEDEKEELTISHLDSHFDEYYAKEYGIEHYYEILRESDFLSNMLK